MKLIITFLSLILLCVTLMAQQAIDWNKIIQGKITDYRTYNIRSIHLRDSGILVKSVYFIQEQNQLVVLNNKSDTLYSLFYDDLDRLYKVIKENKVLLINYFETDTTEQSLSLKINALLTDTLQKTSYPYKEHLNLVQNEFYVVSGSSKDTVTLNYKTTVLNTENNEWSYELSRNNNQLQKKYRNGVSVTINKNNGYMEYDSIVPVAKQKYHFYHYSIFPDSILQTITKDSVYQKKLVNNRMAYEKVSFGNKDVYEVFYNSDSSVSGRIIFTYYPSNTGSEILWKKTILNAEGKKVSTGFPNKKYYKYRKGILKRKPKYEIKLRECGGVILTPIYGDYIVWMLSPSVLFHDDIKIYDNEDYPFRDRILNYLAYYNLLSQDELYHYRCRFFYPYPKPSQIKKTDITHVEKIITVLPVTDELGTKDESGHLPEPQLQIEVITESKEKFQTKISEGAYHTPATTELIFFHYWRNR